MSVALRRTVSLVPALIAILGAIGTADAQVTIHLTTTQQTTCDVVTDANGLVLSPGGTDLTATGVTLSGTGCGGGGAPPTPDNFLLTASATPVTGSPFSVSWSVTGATSCTGSASLNTGSVTLSGWTDVTSATSPRSVIATTAGTYTLSLTCSNTAGSVTSLPAIVVVAQGAAGNCPAGQATVSDIHYLPEPPAHVRHSVDLTLWDNIWGHITESDDVTPWPGDAGTSPTIWSIGKTQYVGALFHTTSSLGLSGHYVNVSYGQGPNLDMSISPTCGDFTGGGQAGCVKTNIPADGSALVSWRMHDPSSFWCALTPNSDYYLNVRFDDPNTTGPGCSGDFCKSTIENYYGGQ
ncbi:MAG TPA: hypothetical protein VGO25_02450 [Rhodanobacteraceae bacterium]|jgi:hypothetical protein|nr:hypothetical protein [Rhodanobacteraceae bacterium]